MTPRTFLLYGLLAGLLAGIVAFGVAYVYGEPPIDEAIAVEEAAAEEHHDHDHGADHDHDHGAEAGGHSHHHDDGAVTRGQQAGPGLATATILLGTVLGGLVGVVAAVAVGRLGALRPGASTAVVAALGFLSFALVPWIKYPPNPPAVGSEDTIGARTAQYFGFVALSILALVIAVLVARALLARTSAVNAVVTGGLVFVVLVLALGYALPAIDEVPDDFPANTLFSFRIGALATQAALWGTLTAVLAVLVDRRFRSESARRELADAVGAGR